MFAGPTGIQALHDALTRDQPRPGIGLSAQSLTLFREHGEVFVFIEHNGPPTNNHAERALRPLVIFRKVCLGTRSPTGSENISVFASLTQTAHLQNAPVLDLFDALLTSSPALSQDSLFNNSS